VNRRRRKRIDALEADPQERGAREERERSVQPEVELIPPLPEEVKEDA